MRVVREFRNMIGFFQNFFGKYHDYVGRNEVFGRPVFRGWQGVGPEVIVRLYGMNINIAEECIYLIV